MTSATAALCGQDAVFACVYTASCTCILYMMVSCFSSLQYKCHQEPPGLSTYMYMYVRLKEEDQYTHVYVNVHVHVCVLLKRISTYMHMYMYVRLKEEDQCIHVIVSVVAGVDPVQGSFSVFTHCLLWMCLTFYSHTHVIHVLYTCTCACSICYVSYMCK